jgi:uncharacterized membrane protein YfcA
MHLAALLGFVAVGLALGLLGGGGSILAVPVLVHLLGIAPGVAVPMSLPVVGITAAVGAYARWRQGQLRLGTVLGFASIAMVTSFAAARLGAGLPDTPRMILFATTMFIAATAMWRRANRMGSEPPSTLSTPVAGKLQIVAAAGAVGVLTGLVGVGGGFLIVPALSGVLGLPLAAATATSLAVIALNTASAGVGWIGRVSLDLPLTLQVTVAALAGMGLGTYLAPHIAARTLTRAFAILLLVLATFLIATELRR